ncbi:type I restriction-modification system subunit M N-terminal domain-containing protein [Phocaeicola coprocola]|uniref:type I restriction-modification system subunit M N-terminal domain-containing protein n=1 Tax=Phocaeicola coprocola TaxID=310298 RepID=UPI004026FC00
MNTQIDNIWDTFWTGGITNFITILEQMTFLFFMKMLDDALKKESSASFLGEKVKDPVFEEGTWCNPKTDKDVPFESLRWSVFKNYDATKMYNTKK